MFLPPVILHRNNPSWTNGRRLAIEGATTNPKKCLPLHWGNNSPWIRIGEKLGVLGRLPSTTPLGLGKTPRLQMTIDITIFEKEIGVAILSRQSRQRDRITLSPIMIAVLRMSSTGLVVGMIFTYSSCPPASFPFFFFWPLFLPAFSPTSLPLLSLSKFLMWGTSSYLRHFLIWPHFVSALLASLRCIVTTAWHRIHTWNPKKIVVSCLEVGCWRRVYLYNTIISSQHISDGTAKRSGVDIWGDYFPLNGIFNYFSSGVPFSAVYILSLYCDTAAAIHHVTEQKGEISFPAGWRREGRKIKAIKKARGRGWASRHPLSATFYFLFFRKVEGEEGTRNPF